MRSLDHCPNCKREFYAHAQDAYCEECWRAWCKNDGTFEERTKPWASLIETPAPKDNPLLAEKHTGMKVDYRGLLKQAQRGLRGDPGIAEMLRQLEGHLTEFGQRWYAGDTAVVDELLQLYCIESDTRAALSSTTEGKP